MADISLRHMTELVNEVLMGGATSGDEPGRADAGPLLLRVLKAGVAALMEAEVSELTGAGYGEHHPERVTSRNGYRKRRLDTGLGTIDLNVPRIRKGSYMPSFLVARKRSDDALRLALAQCYAQGVSTRNAEAIAQALGVENLSKSTVSRMTEVLEPQVEAFRNRALPACPYVFLDARYEKVREDHAVRSVAVLVAVGVREDGVREVLGFGVARVENEAYWSDFLRDLKRRGLRGVKLVVSDAHDGLRLAIENVVPKALWQRCRVHFMRNVSSRVPSRKRPAVLSLVKTIFAQETLEAAPEQRKQVAAVLASSGLHEVVELLDVADDSLTYMRFPPKHWSKLHSTNVVERLNRELKRRTRVVSIFPNRRSIVRLVGTLLLEEHEEWSIARRYISEQSMKQLLEPKEVFDDQIPGAAALLTTSAEASIELVQTTRPAA